MLHPATLKASHSAISSQGSEAGAMHSDLQECRTTSRSGQAPRRANRSASPGSNSDSSTSDTSRQRLCASSLSVALQSFLESRLARQLKSTGSTIYSLSWKEKATPAQRRYCQLAASALRTKEIAFTSGPWATPTTRDHKDGKECPNVPINSLLGRQVWLAAWPTPVANDDNKTPEAHLRMKQRMGERDGTGANRTAITSLQVMAKYTHPLRVKTSGAILTGSDAGMESSGQLNPALSRWLMGFPPEWDDCAVMAMQSSRKSPPSLSEPLSGLFTTQTKPAKRRIRAGSFEHDGWLLMGGGLNQCEGETMQDTPKAPQPATTIPAAGSRNEYASQRRTPATRTVSERAVAPQHETRGKP